MNKNLFIRQDSTHLSIPPREHSEERKFWKSQEGGRVVHGKELRTQEKS